MFREAVDRVLDVHTAQLLTYLKLTNLPVGLLINFNVPLLKRGVRRLTNQEINLNSPAPTSL
jgi:GxxExxY protein